jgi:hypothetical protein
MFLVLLSAAILPAFALVEVALHHINRFSNMTNLTSFSVHHINHITK